MSVYKPEKSPNYHFDFWLGGRRFHGSTGATTKREAERVEATERKAAEEQVRQERASGRGPLTLIAATARYWTEVGQHHAGSATTLRNIKRLVDKLGPDRAMVTITDDDVAKLVAWRRSHTIKGRDTVRDPRNPKATIAAPLITASTVNRSTIEPLQKLFNRARRVWRLHLPNEPDWKLHMLPEPRERVREVRGHEEAQIEAAIRPDYLPLVRFARASGLRLAECLLRKDNVDLHAGRIRTIGKGGKPIDLPITMEMRAILMVEMANPTQAVFTYAAARAKTGPTGYSRGARLAITASGLKTMWRRSRYRPSDALPADLRFHDMRHDFATKLLRETNLKVVQRALHHSKVETTARYAHAMDDDVLAGMEAASKSRTKSRTADSRKNRPAKTAG